MNRICVLAGFVLLATQSAVAQQPVVLTLESAIERAKQSAPAIVAARMRIDEVRRGVFLANPTLEVEGGRRSGETEYGVEIAQDIDLPQRRRARIDATRASLQQEEQRAAEVERATLREVATAILRAIEARERADAATNAKSLAGEAARIAERRYAAGDVAQLDVNLARTAVARADVEVRTANAERTAHTTQLQLLLGITGPIAIEGSLRDALPITTFDVATRADVRLLDAEIAEAEAEQRLARALRWPDFGLRAAFRKEEGDRIVAGGVGLTLPLFQRGQEATTIANARLSRLRAERTALTRAIEAEVRGAIASTEALREAAGEYERNVLPLLEENERLALESYDVGQIGLADLLLVRREVLDARRAFLDQLIATRLAEIDLRAKSGVWK